MRMLRSFGQLFVQFEMQHQTAWLQFSSPAQQSSASVPEHLNCCEPRMALLRSSCLAWGVLLALCLRTAAQCSLNEEFESRNPQLLERMSTCLGEVCRLCPCPGKHLQPFCRGVSCQCWVHWVAWGPHQVQAALARRRGFRAVLCCLPSTSSLSKLSCLVPFQEFRARHVAKSKAIDRSFKMDFETFKTGWLKMFEGKTEVLHPHRGRCHIQDDVFSRWSYSEPGHRDIPDQYRQSLSPCSRRWTRMEMGHVLRRAEV